MAKPPKGAEQRAARAANRYRSHTCGELRSGDIGAEARLSGWVHRVRDHGGLLFIDLRDHYGLTQVAVDRDSPAFKIAERLRSEWVIRVDGKLRARPEVNGRPTINPELPTGEVELLASEIEVLSAAKELPVPVFGEPDYPEDLRLQYRFLDLRRETLHRNIMLRNEIIGSIRRRMRDAGFFEFQTPILTASSPEGARDFLVPSRMHPGKFYALPQAPQQFKQLIMIAGFDRYFQIAPCFRDEDARADRSPGEFYQLDLEMSFVEQEDVFAAVEPVMRGLFEEFSGGKPVTQTFPRIPYDEAIQKYGSDKPDLRNPIAMADVTEHFRGSGFKVFAQLIEKDPKARVWAIPARGGGSRAFCDRINGWAQREGQPGLAYIFWREVPDRLTDADFLNRVAAIAVTDVGKSIVAESGGTPTSQVGRRLSPVDIKLLLSGFEALVGAGKKAEAEALWSKYFESAGPIARNLGAERTEAIRSQLDLKIGDAVFFAAGNPDKFYKFAGEARTLIGRELNLIDEGRFEFCWIVDFPMYEWNEEEKRIDFSHNPFSMPQGGLAALEAAKSNEDLLKIKAYQYDIVCNGVELSSGAIRNHLPEIMYKAFAIAGYGPEVLEAKFGGMLKALQFGAPPHGGIAPGIDRIVMLLAGATNLRDVIMFPMNQQAQDLLMGAPSEVTPKQLRELHIRLAMPERKA
jgi:aspartyl-tRNA synthetase